MRKVALLFVLAVLVPSLVLAWLAVRSLRDQEFLLMRQQSLLYQRVTDAVAKDLSDRLAQEQQTFAAQVETLAGTNAESAPFGFDGLIRRSWPLAEVGFCVSLSGAISSPLPAADLPAQRFLTDNGGFLGNREAAEVYWNANNSALNGQNLDPGQYQQRNSRYSGVESSLAQNLKSKSQSRLVTPQNQAQAPDAAENNVSRIAPAETEFRQLVGDQTDGMIARFLQNQLSLMFWHRASRHSQLVFGAQVSLKGLVNELRPLVQPDPELRDQICLALLNDNAKAVAWSLATNRLDFSPDLKHPFAATEAGEALPHWEVAAYLLHPAQLTQAARTAKLTLGLLVAILVTAIGVGGWLLVNGLSRELKLARQKTDFVSNVSHELKTPLTSIRMFSELMAEGRATDPDKQKSYLNIITAEAARLTRLINNVLDFSRIERGEKKYHFQKCNLAEVVQTAAQTFRPHLEADGFQFSCTVPSEPVPVEGDGDALSQVLVNLLSNAEKYCNGHKEISVELHRRESPFPHAEVRVLDRGLGVPRGSGEKIFEKFYRAHDALSSGIQGSGLGLTLARQIARAHGGDVLYEPRDGGGSCFSLRLPLAREST